jgi:hypothetical protein
MNLVPNYYLLLTMAPMTQAFSLAKLGYSPASVSDEEEIIDFLAERRGSKLRLLGLDMPPKLRISKFWGWIQSQPELRKYLSRFFAPAIG